jgi:GxxExxY protein
MDHIDSRYKFSKLTGLIIGASFEIHNELGPGLPEKIYQRCLELELNSKGLSLDREFTVDVYFKGMTVGKRRLDFVIENRVVVELKARHFLHKTDFIQLKNYLKLSKKEIGLLINFGESSLNYRRCILTQNNLGN